MKTNKEKHLVIFGKDELELMSMREFNGSLDMDFDREKIFYAVLSTGGFGIRGCDVMKPGFVPKGPSAVAYAPGYDGLRGLVELGFIPCVVCHPENSIEFWDTISDIVKRKYGIDELQDFADKSNIYYDASRYDWEKIFPKIGARPDRIYLRTGATADEVHSARERLHKMGFSFEHIGFFDPSNNEWTEYK
jgi:hypothetical protein